MSTADHWENVYKTKDPTKLSWIQPAETQAPTLEDQYISRAVTEAFNAGVLKSSTIIDAGCGSSERFIRTAVRLTTSNAADVRVLGVDHSSAAVTNLKGLLAAPRGDLPALDATVETTRGTEKTFHRVELCAGDVTKLVSDAVVDPRSVSLWHDRAVLHFLSAAEARAYAGVVAQLVCLGGFAVIGVFAADGGPPKCSGIDVLQYDEASMGALVGGAFDVVDSGREMHSTPWGSEQKFAFFLLRRRSV